MGGGRPALDQAASGEPGSEPSPHPWLIPPDAECQRMFRKGQRPWQRPSVPLPVLPCAGTRRSAGVFVRPHVVLCAWDRARPPVTVGELRSRCAHTFVPVRLYLSAWEGVLRASQRVCGHGQLPGVMLYLSILGGTARVPATAGRAEAAGQVEGVRLCQRDVFGHTGGVPQE